MKEVKSPKKPLIYYYCIVLLVLMVFNSFIVPLIARQQIKEVDYGTFMSMTEKGEIGKVEIESNQILFTDKDGQNVYKTGVMDDPNLTERLYASGAQRDCGGSLPADELFPDMDPAGRAFCRPRPAPL